MTPLPSARPPHRDDDEVAAEFARILSDEGLALRPGSVPHEPPAPPPSSAGSAASPASPSPEERERDRARARAAHPSSQRPSRRARDRQDEEDEDELLGDFVPPDPQLAASSDGALWAWTGLLAGVVLLLLTATTDLLPGWCGPLGALIAVAGLVALLLRVPRGRDPFDDGAQV